MKMEHPRCYFCKRPIEFVQSVYAIKTPEGDGFSHIDHEVPKEIRRVMEEPMTYTAWCDAGFGLDKPVKQEHRA